MHLRGRFIALTMCIALLCSCKTSTVEIGVPELQGTKTRTLHFQVSSNLQPEVLEQTDAFADRVAALSGGMLQIEVMTGLPDDKTVKTKEADLAFLSNIQMAQADQLFSMFSMPFLYDDDTHMSVALNSEEIRSVLSQRLSSRGMVPLMAVYNGSNYLATDRRELRKPSDFKGLVIAMRTDNADKLMFFEALGAKVLPYTLSTVVPLFKTKVEILPKDLKLPSEIVTVDTVELSLEQTLQLLPDPQTLYLINTYHSLSPLWIVANRDVMSQLSDYERAILDEGLAGLVSELERLKIAHEQELLTQVKAQGITVVEVERSTIASALYGNKGSGTDRYKPPVYFDNRIYKMIQSFA
ncbi:TRAP transporter substrate-binding protein DctP [Oscillospiraceae bacterium PP1C4]